MRNNSLNIGKSLSTALLLSAIVALGGARIHASTTATPEEADRTVDKAALASQDEAQADLREMLKKYQGTAQEAALLARLADVQQETAAMEFRVVHGDAHRNGKAVNLSTYKKMMGASIPTLTQVIKGFPDYADIAHLYFMRARAYEETGDKTHATEDYLHLTKNFPKSPEIVPAYLSLADFATADSKFALAIKYLKNIESDTKDSHYPLVLSKMAWSYYNLRGVGPSLSYAEKLIQFYAEKAKERKLEGSEQGMLDNVLTYVPVFVFEGYQAKMPEYQSPRVLAYMKKLNDGPELGKMVVSYAKLLRSHDDEKELNNFKNAVLKSEADRPESGELLLLVYEYQLNKGHFGDLVLSAQDLLKTLKKQHDPEEASEAQKLLLETANSLQKLILKNKDSKGVDAVGDQLAAVYQVFSDLVGEKDPRVQTAHVNMAETFFAIQSYEKAAAQYRWVVAHGTGTVANEASLKAISSRYESLRTQNLTAGDLKASALPKKDKGSLNPKVSEWIEWIDAHVKKTGNPVENFQFEADRALYAQGQPYRALDRLQAFAIKNPKSSYALASATLVVDTFIASTEWTKLNDSATQFAEVSVWKGTEFSKRMYKIAADASYKHAEALASAKDYKGAIAQANIFVKHYKNSEHYTDTLILAGNAAFGMGDRKLAIRYYNLIAESSPNSKTAAKAMLAAAKIEEERYSFTPSSEYYIAYLNLPAQATGLKGKQTDLLKKRILTLAWLGGEHAQLHALLANRKICSAALKSTCAYYQALSVLNEVPSDHNSVKLAVRNAKTASPELRSIWAAIALENGKALDWNLRHQMIEELANNWKKVDALARFSLIPSISASVPHSFKLDREVAKASGALKLSGPSLSHRVALIKSLEDSATIAAKLPWLRIHALVLNEVAGVYTDLADGVKRIPPPRQLTVAEWKSYSASLNKMVLPFEQKAQNIRSEAFKLASRASIENDSYQTIAQDYFRTDAKKATIAPPQKSEKAALDLQLIRSVDSQGSWKASDSENGERAQLLRAHWGQAIESRNWAQLGFFMQEAKEKALLPEAVVGVAEAVSLATAGAKAEGKLVLSDLCHGKNLSKAGSRMRDACSSGNSAL